MVICSRAGYFALRRYQRGAWVVAICVLSHWFLDWIVHRPDLPLWPASFPNTVWDYGTTGQSPSAWKAPSSPPDCGSICGKPRARDRVGNVGLTLVRGVSHSCVGCPRCSVPPPTAERKDFGLERSGAMDSPRLGRLGRPVTARFRI